MTEALLAKLFQAFLLAILFLLGRLPLRLLHALGSTVGRLSFYLNSRMARTTVTNLSLCYPDKNLSTVRLLALDSMEASGQFAAEAGLVFGSNKGALNSCITNIVGEQLLSNRAKDKALLLLAPHFGNWEFINLFVASKYGLSALYEAPAFEAFDRALLKARKQHGGEFFPAGIAGVRQLYKVFKRSGIVALLPDQVPDARSALPVEFFGVPALTMTLIAKLIQRFKPCVIFGYAIRLPESKGFELVFQAADSAIFESDEISALSAMNKQIESIIALAPEQYQWEYKRFKRVRAAGKAADRDIYKP